MATLSPQNMSMILTTPRIVTPTSADGIYTDFEEKFFFAEIGEAIELQVNNGTNEDNLDSSKIEISEDTDELELRVLSVF